MVSSLGIVLPAYNEEARLGPALDELFGYLRAANGALPERVSVLVVDDGSTDGTAALVRARPEFVEDATAATGTTTGATDRATPGATPGTTTGTTTGRPAAPALRLLTDSARRQGQRGPGGDARRHGDVLVFADADMATPPDQLPRLVAALETADVALGSRIQPDGSDMRASQPRFRRFVGQGVPLRGADLGDGPDQATPSAGSRGSAARRRATCSAGCGSRASSSTWT
jgi:glycosyltransferase involved in cell wall biosynthesis